MQNQKYQKEPFEEYVKKIMDAYGAVGLALTIVSPQKTKYRQFFGWRDEENCLPVDENTLFGLASITKSFTCLAIMQLHEKRKININDPVSKYIPEYCGAGQKTVKVYHLMSHSAGFLPQQRLCAEQVAREMGIFDSRVDLAYSVPLAEEGVRRIACNLDRQKRYIADPGEFLSYSNDSYGLLSDIVRRYGGEATYADYVKKYILEPLGMERSGCGFLDVMEDKNVSVLYRFSNGQRIADKNFYDSAFVLMGGGAMKSTIADMEKYLRMYLLSGWGEMEQIVQSESIGQMVIPQVNYRFGWKYGFGLAVTKLESMRLIGHGGSLPGVSSSFLWSPELQRGVAALCNTSGVPVVNITMAAMRIMAGLPIEEDFDLKEKPWEYVDIKAACGLYTCGEGMKAEIVQTESGLGLKDGETVFPLKMVAGDTLVFQNKMLVQDLKVFRRKDGSVWGLRRGGRVLLKEQEQPAGYPILKYESTDEVQKV